MGCKKSHWDLADETLHHMEDMLLIQYCFGSSQLSRVYTRLSWSSAGSTQEHMLGIETDSPGIDKSLVHRGCTYY